MGLSQVPSQVIILMKISSPSGDNHSYYIMPFYQSYLYRERDGSWPICREYTGHQNWLYPLLALYHIGIITAAANLLAKGNIGELSRPI